MQPGLAVVFNKKKTTQTHNPNQQQQQKSPKQFYELQIWDYMQILHLQYLFEIGVEMGGQESC